MKTFLIFSISLFFAQLNQAQTMQLMSYNTRFDNPQDGKNNWQYRKENVADMILKNKVELLGVQEALYHQIIELNNLLPNFAWIGVGRDDGKQAGEMMAIFYDSTQLVLLDYQNFWLSETPEVAGSRSWASACNRMVTWARFQEKATKKIFFHFNTHFDHQSKEARTQSALLLKRKIEEIAQNELAIITGDFNLTPSDSVYTELSTKLVDVRELSRTKPKHQNSTFNGFQTQRQKGAMIDFIFVNQKEKIKILSFEVLEDKYNGLFPSDHFPILVQCEIGE